MAQALVALQRDVLRAALHLAELRLSDLSQPPNVRQKWKQLSAACGSAAEIIEADSRRLASGLETMTKSG